MTEADRAQERKLLRKLSTPARAAYRKGGCVGLLRFRMRITQQQFAELLGVSWSTVSRWERGEAEPSRWQLSAMQEIAKAPDESLVFYADRMIASGPVWTLYMLLRTVAENGGQA